MTTKQVQNLQPGDVVCYPEGLVAYEVRLPPVLSREGDLVIPVVYLDGAVDNRVYLNATHEVHVK